MSKVFEMHGPLCLCNTNMKITCKIWW